MNQDQVVALCLLANKIFNDYLICCRISAMEPESYFEKWMELHIKIMNDDTRSAIWKIFIFNLVSFRNADAKRNEEEQQ